MKKLFVMLFMLAASGGHSQSQPESARYFISAKQATSESHGFEVINRLVKRLARDKRAPEPISADECSANPLEVESIRAFRSEIAALGQEIEAFHQQVESNGKPSWNDVSSHHKYFLSRINRVNLSRPCPVISAPLEKSDGPGSAFPPFASGIAPVSDWTAFTCILQESDDMRWILSDKKVLWAHNYPYPANAPELKVYTTKSNNKLISSILIPHHEAYQYLDLWCRGYQLPFWNSDRETFVVGQSAEKASYRDNQVTTGSPATPFTQQTLADSTARPLTPGWQTLCNPPVDTTEITATSTLQSGRGQIPLMTSWLMLLLSFMGIQL